MDLFTRGYLDRVEQPLALRMRPTNLQEFVGQEHILGPNRLLRRAIESDQIGSMILYGPPGTGKTTLAYVISQVTKAYFIRVSATTTGAAELKKIISAAQDRLKFNHQKTILFIDEIQRLNKGQQDVLLPAMEAGDICLIAATTENPYFEVNAALLSRSHIFQLKPLNKQELIKIIKQAGISEKGLAGFPYELTAAALEHLVESANGDARAALNALEFAVMSTKPNQEGIRMIDLEIVEDAVQIRRVNYDKSGDSHYDIVSAFIKSMRGSDPDAALYWFARMLYASEDPRFIVRRLIVHASEDVGMADPTAMLAAHAAANALEWVGLPEARIPIAQAIIHIATAPKSNSVVKAIDQAVAAVETTVAEPVPVHLRDASYSGAKKLQHGVNYKYPHDYPDHYVKQQYLPDNLKGRTFYHPGKQGREKFIKERMDYFAKKN
ncbi:MAG: replication-associated recombination protein A [Firmicutes bacterium]|nr:replication-associated recombination protein A [Bacillota bacterium]